MGRTNWAGNVRFRAPEATSPASVEELCALVRSSTRIRAIGSGHAFNDMADGDVRVSLSRLDRPSGVAPHAGSFQVPAFITYSDLASVLDHHDLALPAMASLPHITLAGAINSATHGSGDRYGNLATVVSGVELVDGSGEQRMIEKDDPVFPATVVGLGCMGIVTRYRLELEPAYQMRQTIYQGMSWEAYDAHYDEVMGAADSVSIFTTWGETVGQVWLKKRVGADPGPERQELFDARPFDVLVHPLPGSPPTNVTPQLGVVGPWHSRLPHFVPEFAPASGNELQSEYFVDRNHAVEAIRAVRAIADRVRPALMASELRTVAADDLWMSTAYGRPTAAIHFTWKPDTAAVHEVIPHVEAALRPFDPRPHWAKMTFLTADDIAGSYPKLPEFLELARHHDPRGVFRNSWTGRLLGY